MDIVEVDSVYGTHVRILWRTENTRMTYSAFFIIDVFKAGWNKQTFDSLSFLRLYYSTVLVFFSFCMTGLLKTFDLVLFSS